MDLDDSLDETGDPADVNNPSSEAIHGDAQAPGDAHVVPLETSKDAPAPLAFHHRKWERLRKHYRDQYLDVFKETFGTEDKSDVAGDLLPTQLGAVLWQPDEKARLYDALDRKGRHDLRALSTLVATKSEVEIKAYLDNLRGQETDRQRFEAQPKNISHADIPAAIEIGRRCEAVLDTAAAALSAFQEQYDATVGQNRNDLWFIDHELAAELDRKSDEFTTSDNTSSQESDETPAPISERAIRAFRLSTFLELSECFFMNKDADSPDSWQNIAEEDQRPALTLDCVTLFYDLTVNLTCRLIQSALFTAKSRIRAAASKDYRPGELVRSEDVHAALDVLGVTKDSDTFWIGLARRNGLRVVDDAHRRGVDAKTAMSYEKVEGMLSSRSRNRSDSRTSTISKRSDSTLDEISDAEDPVSDNLDDSGSDEDEHSSAENSDSDAASEGAEVDNLNGQDYGSSSEEHPTSRMPREKRIQLLEQEQDDYLEKMDREARRREESRLVSLISPQEAQEEKDIKDESSVELGSRPRVLRKAIEDCLGWSVEYEAEWERHKRTLPLESASVAEPAPKRRRLEPESDQG
ncbi:hypothetical protein AYO21_10039 [Fonsecaea monophora]|uniref:Myb-like domain-containing protein n=1 Tax=Fonsecaea monophora TaxID=254056 RepID=A0A177EUU8_9EURO|nr:hypothetical protein AYO21_10039 [Fonsecaea monophora]KAH0830808.1 hypothetical protein FOPE_02006 [Fonsecaea pedrosoi]OAG35805.1 hypothetical protein AYO21_10039 [Fonsecaea monophora]